MPQKGVGFSAHKVFGAKYYPVGGWRFSAKQRSCPDLVSSSKPETTFAYDTPTAYATLKQNFAANHLVC